MSGEPIPGCKYIGKFMEMDCYSADWLEKSGNVITISGNRMYIWPVGIPSCRICGEDNCKGHEIIWREKKITK